MLAGFYLRQFPTSHQVCRKIYYRKFRLFFLSESVPQPVAQGCRPPLTRRWRRHGFAACNIDSKLFLNRNLLKFFLYFYSHKSKEAMHNPDSEAVRLARLQTEHWLLCLICFLQKCGLLLFAERLTDVLGIYRNWQVVSTWWWSCTVNVHSEPVDWCRFHPFRCSSPATNKRRHPTVQGPNVACCFGELTLQIRSQKKLVPGPCCCWHQLCGYVWDDWKFG